ncbi:MAG TPA: dihydroorotate dehydrogenase electron transfer subunit, partial [Methanolinea sp.]|nr:dihydroorotate dehydrogenase electron transfer subunit [Methanolinea sp.]HQE85271.1 dihydroorotate dehydrogenase electron transfer subunit [Methanolinea sp.]HQI14175.1 dihydroorotate dehydrogenase electron transfer subunit [Methanolinea sp.]HQJ18179.1 dihydroorotate dehydrogenase electron transfer subunit [Methanolinea sp.]
MSDGLPVPVRITRVVRETPSVATFAFDREFSFVPGQFVMVWVPGVDEVPMALSSPSSITVQRVGDATAALFRLGPGDSIGIRGPFGNGFPQKRRMLAVAG